MHAASPPDFTLSSERWHQLAILGDSTGLTIEQLFGDDLPASEYNDSWAIFLWDSALQQYVNPGLSGSIPTGHGFWMLQKTGSPVSLDVPDVESVTTKTSPACSSANGCSEIPLTSNSNADLYNMVGSALPLTLDVDAIRLVSDSVDGICKDGCSPSEAAELDLVGRSLWHYDATLGSYRDLSETGSLNPWESFWVVAKSELAGSATSYLFPTSPADPPEVDLLANIDSAGNLDTRDTSVNLPAFPGATCRRSDFECGSASANGGVQQPYSFPNHSMAAQVSSGNGTAIKDVSLVANVMGNTVARSPQLRSVSVGEVVNNMMFNVYGIVVLFSQKPGSAPSNGYIIGNTIKHGPDTVLPAARQLLLSGGNYAVSGNTQIERDGTVTREFESNGVTTIAAGPRTTLLGNNKLNVQCVGASVPVRDSWDARMIAEMNGTGTDPVLDSAEVGIGPRVGPVWMPGDSRVNRFYEPGIDDQGQRDWSTYTGSNTHPANYDTDNDGIADSFENDVIALDPNDNFGTLADIDHTTVHPDGYTYFEKWTHNLAASCATGR